LSLPCADAHHLTRQLLELRYLQVFLTKLDVVDSGCTRPPHALEQPGSSVRFSRAKLSSVGDVVADQRRIAPCAHLICRCWGNLILTGSRCRWPCCSCLPSRLHVSPGRCRTERCFASHADIGLIEAVTRPSRWSGIS